METPSGGDLWQGLLAKFQDRLKLLSPRAELKKFEGYAMFEVVGKGVREEEVAEWLKQYFESLGFICAFLGERDVWVQNGKEVRYCVTITCSLSKSWMMLSITSS